VKGCNNMEYITIMITVALICATIVIVTYINRNKPIITYKQNNKENDNFKEPTPAP
jgi:preprotein translocase subunit SecY